jgi:hypothetical protein
VAAALHRPSHLFGDAERDCSKDGVAAVDRGQAW